MAGEPLDIDVAAATAAFSAAQSAENTPDAVEPAPSDESVEAPAEGAAPAEETPAADDFTNIPDDALTPELLQMKRSLQADYTRKTQEVAPWRKAVESAGLQSPEDMQNAMDAYAKLSDPRNWPTIHQELSEYMQQYGMSPQQANVAAGEQLAQFVPAEDIDQYTDDGVPVDNTPPQWAQQLIQQNQALQAKFDAQETERARAEAWTQTAQRLTAAENEIRSANKDYDDDDITAIYRLLGPEGDLHVAQQQYESVIGHRVSKIIAKKQSPKPVTGGSQVAGVAGEQAPAEPHGKLTMDEGHAAALAAVAAMDQAGL